MKHFETQETIIPLVKCLPTHMFNFGMVIPVSVYTELQFLVVWPVVLKVTAQNGSWIFIFLVHVTSQKGYII